MTLTRLTPYPPIRVLIRCDASLAIGSGHVLRCRNLARGLQRRGAEVLFVCRERPGALNALLAEEFAVMRLPALPGPEPCPDGLEGRDLYRAWLGCSQLQDVDDCLDVIRTAGPGPIHWLVVDHYGLDQQWEGRICDSLSGLQDEPPRLLVFDDLADRTHQAAVLVDANRMEANAWGCYRALVPASCRLLLGPAYAQLDPLYAQLQPLAPQRRTLRRVLVFFGGVDQANYTALAFEALCHPDLACLAVDVVLGSAAPHSASIQKLAQQRPHTELHRGLPSLAGLMVRADLAIGAAGTASWERAALALPTIVIPVADNQRQGAQAIAEVGAAIFVDLQEAEDPSDQLIQVLLTLQDRPELLSQLSDRARALGDGHGLGRLLTVMLGPITTRRLRPTIMADEDLYYRWANDSDVRRQSFSSDPIPLEQHQSWFRGRMHSPNAILRVLVDGEGLPLGQIRFERSDSNPDRALISFSLDQVIRGQGVASELIQRGMVDMKRQWGSGVEAYGEVRATNEASAKSFLRAGFIEGHAPRPGVRCFSKLTGAFL
ncbi:UDP-2,4-diacetamido-2,4,6-trideoxy-beta-L-altropyranose hydrolase [Cyanobium sp. Maggiore-St4-Cus]|uniref:UDP-2,4-diacetamido-2,4, 6-trideoxy-beta-L-altropyranose hydrolase n=1 Tax=Cyanobium sp. Maggiore-St4-Cus TaxID=2823717 RepID=UPI0020CD9152|nr:UDP-2,4-diacetamido-2,4,6-trideoxy-beta-L-altropyranose hydrolase [Cyanobium sp. Maggiore-St4-Cus]MCP9787674.1 UDP-2,4-diacetamido-2,4,6-trideoxy-beta-L-altropyranose hydrolase [Cyanobium sp. Maggiore-St4-Cus]